jgi:hypothetical protein
MIARLSSATGNKRAALSERGHDCYPTPPVAVHALLRVEPLPRVIWEPANGFGAITGVLRRAGHRVYASDLGDYGCPDADHGIDFLRQRTVPYGVQAVVTNPPFKLAEEFVQHALALGVPMVVMLLRLAFLESERRSPILDSGRLTRVHVFKNRLPMMHRHGWEGQKASSAIAFAWFCWDADHHGPAELDRISWEAPS